MMTLDEDSITRILAAARDAGLQGFAGNCGIAAVAINRVLFDGQGRIIAAFNEPFFDHGRCIGHIVVEQPGTNPPVYWDSDALPKDWEQVESWGVLDDSDPDYIEQARALGFDLAHASADEVACIHLENEKEVLQSMPGDPRLLGLFETLIRDCLANHRSQDRMTP